MKAAKVDQVSEELAEKASHYHLECFNMGEVVHVVYMTNDAVVVGMHNEEGVISWVSVHKREDLPKGEMFQIAHNGMFLAFGGLDE